MCVTTQDIWYTVLKTLGLNENIDLFSMHLSEIEEEAENVLDLLTVLRSNAYHSDHDSAQESAAELVITLEHLLHHVHELLPQLQKQLDIEP